MTPRLCLAALALSACAALGGQPTNLLANGGFEQGLAGWTPDKGHTLAAEPGAAHRGKACLTGEVTQPSRHLRLVRDVPVRAGNLYEFAIWARAMAGSSLKPTPPDTESAGGMRVSRSAMSSIQMRPGGSPWDDGAMIWSWSVPSRTTVSLAA